MDSLAKVNDDYVNQPVKNYSGFQMEYDEETQVAIEDERNKYLEKLCKIKENINHVDLKNVDTSLLINIFELVEDIPDGPG